MREANGWLFLAIATLICIGAFFNGLRFARMTKNPWKDRRLFGMPVEGQDMPIEKIRWMGRVQMIFAPLFLILVICLVFGVLGPVDGISIIKFH